MKKSKNIETAYQELVHDIGATGKTIADIKAIRIEFEGKKIHKLEDLHFKYDGGFGGDEFYGHVLFNDRTWLERREYDGASWWVYMKYPSELEDLNAWLK